MMELHAQQAVASGPIHAMHTVHALKHPLRATAMWTRVALSTLTIYCECVTTHYAGTQSSIINVTDA